MKQGSVYYLEHKIIIHSCSKTKAGLWVANEPYIILERNASINEIANAIFKSLDESKQGVLNPTNWTEFSNKYLLGLGLKSWKEVKKKSTKYCYIKMDKNIIEFIPTKHDIAPNNAGFIDIKDEIVNVAFSATFSEVYEALQIALNKCK